MTVLVVGTALVLLNQGNVILSGSWQPDLYWKVPLTYCVPFMVATWGALANGRR
ncbi:MAG: nitrate/nitrite transporter NrtS [Dehalococcoidia bacterium]|nr:nitrate/nitrite transporter NrtS [Dehalococcoidia bacterium]